MSTFELKHYYQRPEWTCGTCKEEWPCRVARILLIAEFAGKRHHLRMIMGVYHQDAMKDMVDVHADVAVFREQYDTLYRRFFNWIDQNNWQSTQGLLRENSQT